MSDVAKQRGLKKRGDVYWHRVFVPKDLRDAYQREEITASLGTRDRAEAINKAKERDAAFVREFADKRRELNREVVSAPTKTTLSASERRQLAERYYATRVADEPFRRRALLKKARTDEGAFWRGELIPAPADKTTHRGKPYSYWTDVCPDLPLEDALLYAVSFDNNARQTALERAMKLGDCDDFLPQACAIAPDVCEEDRERLALDLMAAELKALATLTKADPISVASAVAAPAAAVVTEGPNNPLLATVIKPWLDEKRRWDKVPLNQTLDASEAALTLFIEIVGDKPIADYTLDDTRVYKETIQKLPTHRLKKPETRDVSALAAVKIAAKRGMKLLSKKAVNDRLSNCFNCFDYLCKHYSLRKAAGNPFERVRLKDQSSKRKAKAQYTSEELNCMFADVRMAGDTKRNTAAFWLPLLALYTGARANELCSLAVADIGQEDGVWRIDINQEPFDDPAIRAAVKTDNSERRVPLHGDIVGLGFLDFVAAQRKRKVERLFPELKPESRDGKLQRDVCRDFNNWLADIGVKRPKLDFHSFRHNFTRACEDARIPDGIIMRLKGEALMGELDRYGDGKMEIQVLAEEVAKIKFKGLDLSPLMKSAVVVE